GRAVWLRRGVVDVREVRMSGGTEFLIVRPFGWSGDDGWIAVSGVTEQLRRLVPIDDAVVWLREVPGPTSERPRGDLLARRGRYERTIGYGTPRQQVDALAHAYAEAHRPDVDDVRVMDLLERLILVEIACALGRDLDGLRAELRAGRPRFG